MDRWSNDDDIGGKRKQPMGAVAKGGLAAFVKAGAGMGSTEATAAPAAYQQATVTMSKREQAQAAVCEQAAQQRHTTAGPAPADSPHPSGFRAPSWAALPPPGAKLIVTKSGVTVQDVPLKGKATLFGRLASADVSMEHASISRQHAVLCFRPDSQAVLMDLDSAHGTFVEQERLKKHEPRGLEPGEAVRFGASTRQYALQQPAQVQKRKRGVAWLDEASPGATRQVGNSLESVIGYTDSRSFQANVGPVAVDSSEARGRFADVVSPVVRPSTQQPRQPAASSADEATLLRQTSEAKHRQANFRELIESRSRSSTLYDELPPAAAKRDF